MYGYSITKLRKIYNKTDATSAMIAVSWRIAVSYIVQIP